jgi:hypothetical protein
MWTLTGCDHVIDLGKRYLVFRRARGPSLGLIESFP